MSLGGWHVSVDEGVDKVTFLGAPGRFVARPFRGRIHREMALGLRALEVPSCRNQIRAGWTVDMPDRWEARDNARDRTLMVFGCPNVGVTVLEFFMPVPSELAGALVEAFTGVSSATNDRKETNHGSEGQQGRPAEARRRVLPLPEADVAAGEGDGGGHGEGPVEPDEPAGQQVTKTTPAWTRRLAKMARRATRRGRR